MYICVLLLCNVIFAVCTFLLDAVALPGGHFGLWGEPVLVYDLVCHGTESSLLDCSHSTSIDGDRDYRDPGVFCSPC